MTIRTEKEIRAKLDELQDKTDKLVKELTVGDPNFQKKFVEAQRELAKVGAIMWVLNFKNNL